MSKSEFLNFKEISDTVLFEEVLNWLNMPFERKGEELRGEGFIINVGKNLFFNPENNEIKGSVINFVAHHNEIELRDAALLLKEQFLAKKKVTKPKREMPNLTLEWDPYIEERGITPEMSKEYEIGMVKERSIVAGRIAFKVYDHSSAHIGYIGYRKEDGNWFYPKGFKRPLYNAHKVKDTKSVIVTTDPFDALRIISMGFKQTVSLLAKSMTSEQEQELKKYRYILLFHNEPANIVNRLFASSFIKAPVLSKPLNEMSNDELVKLIKPS